MGGRGLWLRWPRIERVGVVWLGWSGRGGSSVAWSREECIRGSFFVSSVVYSKPLGAMAFV